MPATGTGQHKGPVLHANNYLHVTQTQLNELGYKVLPHLPYSADLLPTSYHFFKHFDNFLQGKCFRNQQKAEDAFQEFIESRSMDFSITGINKLISHRQKSVDCNVPILINKDIFEPSYNDLKFSLKLQL